MEKRFDESSFLLVSKDGEAFFQRQKDHARDPRKYQLNTLKRIIDDNKTTEYGRKYNFEAIKSYEDYKNAVPLTEYEDYQPYIERMVENGEKSLLTAYPIVYYALTSGSTGVAKMIPVSDKNRELFSAYAGSMIIYQTYEQIKKQNHKPGPVCFLTEFRWDPRTDTISSGSISSQIPNNFVNCVEDITTTPRPLQFLAEPTPDATYVKALFALKQKNTSCIAATFSSVVYEFLTLIEQKWESLVRDIRNGEIDPELSISAELKKQLSDYISPDPDRADELFKEFSKGFDTPIIPRIWPNISMICCIGGSFFSKFTKKIRYRYSDDIPMHMMAYGASESMMAIPFDCNDEDYYPLVDDVFFEFREVDADEADRVYLLDELEPGKDYEVIITNMSGLYRYRMFDVIHISKKVDNSPKGRIKYRLNQVVSMVGERTTTEQLDDIMKSLSDHVNVDITNYALYPDYSTSPVRYIIMAEPDEYIGKGNQKKLGPVADKLLKDANRSFKKYREQRVMGEPLVNFLEPGSFDLYREIQIADGASANQIKPVKVIDSKQKIRFFFGLSEGPYKAIKRLLFEAEQKLRETKLIESENKRLKKENAELKKRLNNV